MRCKFNTERIWNATKNNIHGLWCFTTVMNKKRMDSTPPHTHTHTRARANTSHNAKPDKKDRWVQGKTPPTHKFCYDEAYNYNLMCYYYIYMYNVRCVTIQNLWHIELDIWRSVKVKFDGVAGYIWLPISNLTIQGYIMIQLNSPYMFNRNICLLSAPEMWGINMLLECGLSTSIKIKFNGSVGLPTRAFILVSKSKHMLLWAHSLHY